MPASAPFSPSTTSRRSLSSPTQAKTMSQPFAACAGVAAHCAPYCFLRLFLRAVVDRHVVSGRYQMSRHGVAHDAKSQKSNFAHLFSLVHRKSTLKPLYSCKGASAASFRYLVRQILYFAPETQVFSTQTHQKKAFSPSSAVKAARSCAAKDDVLAASHLLFVEKPQHFDY